MTGETYHPIPRALLALLLAAQVSLLRLSFAVHDRLGPRRPRGYVVGMEEIAGLLGAIGDTLDAVTVTLGANPLYERAYDIDFDIRGRGALLKRIRRLVVAPWVLGRLAARHRTFVYLGSEGFLVNLLDGRDREFAWLRRHDRRVVCYFAGSDIRSYHLLDAFGRDLGREVLTTHEPKDSPGIDSPLREQRRRDLAAAADRHADLIISAPVDQMSYLRRPTEPKLHFFPDERIRRRPDKWTDLSRPVLVHAPTAPALKGTPLVRAAVRRLEDEGYAFEYVELMGRPNTDVLATLERAHIALNQFYAFIPGVFGLEAMAANAVMLCSADCSIEPSLPPGGNTAWVVTPSWAVYDNLKAVLDAPEQMQAQADRGTRWMAEHCSRSVDRPRLIELLARVEA